MSRSVEVTAAVNELFAGVDEGFVNSKNEPAMITPLIEVAIIGSTICLIC